MRPIRNFFGAILGFPRRIPKLIAATDNLLLLLVGVGCALALSIFVLPVAIPTLAPIIPTGVSCNRLAAPLGGNSRSMLSLVGNDFQQLDLDLILLNKTVREGETMKVRVVFTNKDIGSIILFMPPTNDIIQNSPAAQGVQIEIRNLLTNQVVRYGIPAGAIPQSSTYRESEIHLLQSREHCQQQYTLDLNLPVGEYTILARYANTQAGVRSAVAGEVANPFLPTQGVWVSNTPLVSPELRFSIQPPPSPTPIVPVQ